MTRENRVPYYQRLFQRHDGKRQWNKVSLNTPSSIPKLHRLLAFQERKETLWPWSVYRIMAGQ